MSRKFNRSTGPESLPPQVSKETRLVKQTGASIRQSYRQTWMYLRLLTLDPSVSSERSGVLPLDRHLQGGSVTNLIWTLSIKHMKRVSAPQLQRIHPPLARWPFWGSLRNPRAKTKQQPASQNTPGL